MANHIFALVTIMLMAGVFGGLLNFYMQSQADTDSTSMPRSLIGGLAGAFVVPLVLFLVSSDLVVASQGDPSGMLIFGGFCLIAAWTSRFAMTTVTKRIQQESHLARKKADPSMSVLRNG